MSPRASSLPLEELLSHATWVRRLARSLVTGEDRADDVAQETWLHALRAPPADRSNVRGWLTRVAQNVARKLARGDARRERREADAPPPSQLPSPEESLERATLQRRVVDAVLALDEIYRSALLLRFFEELPPTAVASALGVPIETARTRIKRGIELVRERLVGNGAADRGEIERALAPLLSWKAASSAAIAGVTVMTGTAWKLAGAAVVVAALAFVGTKLIRSPRVTRSEPEAAARPHAAPPDATAVVVDSTAKRIEEDAPAARGESLRLLRGFVVDGAGVLVPEATIAWSGTDRVETVDGEYAIAGLAPGLVTFHVEAGGCRPLDLTLDLAERAGEQRHDFVLARTILIPVELRTPDGTPLFRAADQNRAPSDVAFNVTLAVTERPLPPFLPPRTMSGYPTAEAAGRAFLVGGSRGTPSSGPTIPDGADGVIEATRLPIEATLLFQNVVVASRTVARADETVRFTVDPGRIETWMGRITGTCIDATSGEPLSRVDVDSGTDNCGLGHVRSEDGSFDFARVVPGWIKLNVSARGHETWHRHVLVKPGETTDLGEIELESGLELTGTIRGLDGRPAEAWFGVLRLDRYVRGEPFYTHDYAGSGEAGKLQVHPLGRGRYVLTTMPGDLKSGAAIVVVDLTSGVAPPPLDVRLQPATFVQIAPQLASGEFLHAEVTTAAGVLVWANGIALPGAIYLTLPSGGYVMSLFDGERLVRSVSFEVAGERILVEFDAHGDRPATISPIDPAQQRSGLSGTPTPTDPALPTSRVTREPGLVIAGSLRDRSGAPIGGGTITAADETGRSRRARTGAKGDFALPGLASGRLDLTATADGCLDAAESVELEGDAPRRVDLVLDRSTRVLVRLTDLQGAPLLSQLRNTIPLLRAVDLAVVATLEAPGDRLPRSLLGAGRFRPGASGNESLPGTLDVDAPLPVFVSAVFGERVLATQELSEPVSELTLAIDPTLLSSAAATLRFRLIDARTSEPILTAFAGVTSMGSFTSGPPTTLSPESRGVFELPSLPPGRQLLCVALPNENPCSFVVDLAAGGTTDLGDLRILHAIALHGIVVDESGAPSKTSLRAILYDGSGQPQLDGGYLSVDPDAQGRFTVPAATPRVRFQASGRDFALDPVVVDTLQAAASETRIVVRRGVVVTLRARLAPGEARRVALYRADGELLATRTFRSSVPQQLRLVPGSYRAVIERDGAPPDERSFVVDAAPLEVAVGR